MGLCFQPHTPWRKKEGKSKKKKGKQEKKEKNIESEKVKKKFKINPMTRF